MEFNMKEHLEEEVERLRAQAKLLAEARDYAGAAVANAQADGISYAIGVINGTETGDRIREEVRATANRVALMQ